ncbi:hypothetical protein [Frankia sp. AvcI1]|uniref:hypothetical protein n=1 Tax=Frankia sp. AvcI1 TaxID=573496 RepID=UPI000ADB91CE|nr:hypothetical protein [Frankia sp. AvcI1]
MTRIRARPRRRALPVSTGTGQQSLEFTAAASASLVTASLDQGVNVEVLRPVLDIVRR